MWKVDELLMRPQDRLREDQPLHTYRKLGEMKAKQHPVVHLSIRNVLARPQIDFMSLFCKCSNVSCGGRWSILTWFLGRPVHLPGTVLLHRHRSCVGF